MMTLRDLCYFDFFKLILVIEYLLGFIALPFVLLTTVIFHETPITITSIYDGMKFFGIAISTEGVSLLPLILLAFVLSIVGAIIKSLVLAFICKHTRLGKLGIGKFYKPELA